MHQMDNVAQLAVRGVVECASNPNSYQNIYVALNNLCLVRLQNSKYTAGIVTL